LSFSNARRGKEDEFAKSVQNALVMEREIARHQEFVDTLNDLSGHASRQESESGEGDDEDSPMPSPDSSVRMERNGE
jgi:hypothetical protein